MFQVALLIVFFVEDYVQCEFLIDITRNRFSLKLAGSSNNDGSDQLQIDFVFGHDM